MNNVSFGIDYFNVRLENTIVNGVNPAIILGDNDAVRQPHHPGAQTPADIAAGIPGPITSINQININLGTTKTSGLDFDLQVAHPHGGDGALHHRRHGHLLHRVRHLESRRLVHGQRRPHQCGRRAASSRASRATCRSTGRAGRSG